jgi:hypothetical protein
MTGIILKESNDVLVEFEWNNNKCSLPIPQFQSDSVESVPSGTKVEFDIKHTSETAVALITKIHPYYDFEL